MKTLYRTKKKKNLLKMLMCSKIKYLKKYLKKTLNGAFDCTQTQFVKWLTEQGCRVPN